MDENDCDKNCDCIQPELLACPFCEGEAMIDKIIGARDKDSDKYFVMCQECLGQTNPHFTEEEAIQTWNSRPIEDACKPSEEFTMRVAHIIFKDGMTSGQKLDCIKLRYREMAFPEHPLSEIEQQLVDGVYNQ